MTPLHAQFHFSPVSLIKHHVLHILQLQVHLHDNVHQTTEGTDDSEGESAGVRTVTHSNVDGGESAS